MQPAVNYVDSPLLPILIYLREMSSRISAPLLLWSLFLAALLMSLYMSTMYSEDIGDESIIPEAGMEEYLTTL